MEKKTVKVRILDEVSVFIAGLDTEHHEYFYEKYSVFAPNYFFNPKYKLGQWDGKIRYFQKTGRTYLYLMDDLLPRIFKLGYKIALEDLRKARAFTPDPITNQIFAHINHIDTGKPIILRDDQVDAVNSLICDGNGLCIASTGAGKTFVTAAITHTYGEHGMRVLTIVPDGGLIRQTKADYVNFGLDTGEYSGKVKTLDHQHVVSTWQSLKNNPKVVELFNVVIVDECLDGNTQIMMANGQTKPIKFINPGDQILSYNESLNVFEFDTVIKRHENLSMSSLEKMYILTFDNETSIEVTGNHKILTTDGYVRADELTSSHEIISICDRVT